MAVKTTIFKNLSKKFNKKEIVKTTKEVFDKAFVKNEFTDQIEIRLYEQGTDKFDSQLSTDAAFGGNYSPVTQEAKRKAGQKFAVVTLRDTGDFYSSIKMIVGKTFYQLQADFNKPDGHIYENFQTSYSDKLSFEDAILGLTKDQLEDYYDRIFLPEFLKIYKEWILTGIR